LKTMVLNALAESMTRRITDPPRAGKLSIPF
jgi:hypothetical protein